jgi:hypothetical protein
MPNAKLLFTGSILGLTALTAVIFIISRLLLANQPEVEGIVSIIWTIAFIVSLYKIMVYFNSAKGMPAQQQRQNLFGALSFLFETLAMVVLLLVAVQFAFTMTSDNNAQLVLPIAASFLCVLAVPAVFRFLKLLSRRSDRLKGAEE